MKEIQSHKLCLSSYFRKILNQKEKEMRKHHKENKSIVRIPRKSPHSGYILPNQNFINL